MNQPEDERNWSPSPTQARTLLALHHRLRREPIPGFDEPEGSEKPSKVAIAGSKTITRTDFDALDPWKRAAKIKDGFNVVD